VGAAEAGGEGFYGALLAATQTDRFSAVIASNGYADL